MDVEELEKMDASAIHARRLNAEEVLMPKVGEFVFPFADRSEKLAGRDQVFRKSTLNQVHPARGEEHSNVFLEESDGPQPSDQEAADAEARDDFWNIAGNHVYRHHVQERIKLCVPKEGSFHFNTQVH